MNIINNVEYMSIQNNRANESYNYINDSTLMKKVEYAQQDTDMSLRPCPDFADIVSIISQQDQSKTTDNQSIADQRK